MIYGSWFGEQLRQFRVPPPRALPQPTEEAYLSLACGNRAHLWTEQLLLQCLSRVTPLEFSVLLAKHGDFLMPIIDSEARHRLAVFNALRPLLRLLAPAEMRVKIAISLFLLGPHDAQVRICGVRLTSSLCFLPPAVYQLFALQCLADGVFTRAQLGE